MKRLIHISYIIFVLAFVSMAQNKKYGVFVGIGKYPDESKILLSSGKDAIKMRETYAASGGIVNTKLLIDNLATRKNILQGIIEYRNSAKSGDTFLFYYSGHGTLFPDRLSEERDEGITPKILMKGGKLQTQSKAEKYDSALIPVDSTENTDNKPWKNLILDDELYRLFAGFTNKGVKVVFISDSCYSGGQAKVLELDKEEENKLLGKAKFLNWKEAIGIKEESEINKNIIVQRNFVPDPSLQNLYLLVASSQDDEKSFSKNPLTGFENSLFTFFFLETYNKYKQIGKTFTFETILKEVKPQVQKYAIQGNEKQNPKIDISFFKQGLGISVF